MADILVVDDERVLREGLKTLLSGEGHAVRTARDGEEAMRKIVEKRPDLILLDVMMPKMNGFRCCEEIRKGDALLPVIFLTAKTAEADQVRGIGLGADDYISKDSGEAVILARIERALARVREIVRKDANTFGSQLRMGDIVVDFKSSQVKEKGKVIACLTRTERDILKLLGEHQGKLFSLDDIISELRGNGFSCADSMVYVHVFNLRSKLSSAARHIVHKRGVGYGFF